MRPMVEGLTCSCVYRPFHAWLSYPARYRARSRACLDRPNLREDNLANWSLYTDIAFPFNTSTTQRLLGTGI